MCDQNYGNYEKRHYPEAVMACTYDLVDQAGDPLAGLEGNNPYTIMNSRRSDHNSSQHITVNMNFQICNCKNFLLNRFQKTPQSIMFRRLFKYISGVNQEGKEIAMTRPVSSLHKVGLQKLFSS